MLLPPLARRPLAPLLLALAALAIAGAPGAAHAATPKRIVAITPFTANILAQLRVRPVAVASPAAGEQGLSSALNGVARLKLSHPNGPNLEQLVALRPDALFSSPTWRAGTPRIQRLGITVYDSLDPQRLGTVPIAITKIASIVGKGPQGTALATRVQAGYRGAQKGITRHPRVLLAMGLAQYTLAILRNSWGGDIITAAGGNLVTKGIKPIGSGQDAVVGNLSNEAVVRMNPDVIIVVPHGSPSDVPTIAKYYRKFAPWRTTKAARTGQIYVPTDDLLLQATSDPAALIRTVRSQYLHN
jgi:iron complex transport system substrate-binding protein